MKPHEIYNLYRLKILAENELVHQRTILFVTLQSFLFISLAVLSSQDSVKEYQAFAFLGYSAVGIVSAIVTFISVKSAFVSIRETHDQWIEIHLTDGDAIKKEYLGFPALTGGVSNKGLPKKGAILATTLPFVVLLFWVGVLAVSFATASTPLILLTLFQQDPCSGCELLSTPTVTTPQR